MHTYVIGHLKPDTDSVVAAIALATLYQNAGCFGRNEAIAAIAGPVNGETKFLLDKFNTEQPVILEAAQLEESDRVVLVDHNEASQRLEGLKQSQIIEIIDHHKANLNFSEPIFLTFKTWGSSNSIIYFMMKKNGFVPDQNLAGLMLAAILSDTVGFKSSTCTDKDRELAMELAAIAQISDLEAFTLEIFKAKSSVGELSDREIVENDYKVFDFHGKQVMIDQLETVEQAQVLEQRQAGLLEAMTVVKAERKVDYIFVAVTDILQVNTKLLLLDEAHAKVAEKAFNASAAGKIIDIGAKLSRKKDIAPQIETALAA
jgi:manganese-dependent inorganic pyrophosphatase